MVYGSIYGSTNESVSFNPDYAYPDAVLCAVQEANENEQRMFDIIIEKDFLEAASYVNEGMAMELQAVNEGFASSVWEKVVDSLKKAWEVIKAAATAAKTKLSAFFTKDNAALVDKYGEQFRNANDKIEIKKFKVLDTSKLENWAAQVVSDLNDKWEAAKADIDSAADAKAAKKVGSNKDYGKTKLTTDLFGKDAKKKFLKDIFSREKDVKLGTIKPTIENTLTNSQASLEEIDAVKKLFDDMISGYIDEANALKDRASSEEDKKNKDLYTAQGNACNTVANNIKSVGSTAIGWALDATKENIKQCRKAFIKGATNVNVKSIIKDSAEIVMVEAMMDADDISVDSFFEQYSYDYDELVAE